jgi:hypothetical protein
MDGVPTQTAGTSEILASDWNTYVRDNFDSIKFGHIVCTSSTRPTGISEGTMIYETDTNKALVYNGSSWIEIHDLDNNGGVSDAALSVAPAGVVSSLPGSPTDGQIIYYTADATNGVYWQLRYRSASSSSYKWEFIGGSPLTAAVLTEQSLGSTTSTWVDLSTSGPSITNPLAGDYLIEWSNRFSLSSNAAFIASGIAFGATDPTGVNPGNQWVVGAGIAANTQGAVASADVKTSLAASTVIKLRYWQGQTNNTAANRFLKVTPIRVG